MDAKTLMVRPREGIAGSSRCAHFAALNRPARPLRVPALKLGRMARTIDPRVDIGHVHLKVSDIDRALDFYRDVLGFDVTQRYGDEAAFLSAGGYHHHIGANTWESAGATPPPPGSAALRHATILLPDESERDRILERLEAAGRAPEHDARGLVIRDPSGNALALAIA